MSNNIAIRKFINKEYKYNLLQKQQKNDARRKKKEIVVKTIRVTFLILIIK